MSSPSRSVPGLVLCCAALAAAGCASVGAPHGAPASASARTSPPRVAVPLLEHRLSPDQLRAREAAARTACDEALAAIAALPDGQRTFENTVDALEQAEANYTDAASRLSILKDVHPDAPVREAAGEVEEESARYLVSLASRRDLHRAVKGWQDGPGKQEQLDPEQARLLELTLRDFRRNGLELPDAGLARLVELRSRLAELSTQFQRNLNENHDGIEVSQEELAGLPPSFVGRLQRSPQGAYRVTTQYPDYYPFMENARSRPARERLYRVFWSRAGQRNTSILVEAIRLRDEEARLLGYPTHADFVTEVRMARSGENVRRFLADLRAKLRPVRDRLYGQLLELERQETGDAGVRLEAWDVVYYLNALKKRDFALDDEALREYFPAETVLRGMFGVYEALLGVRIAEVTGADVWDPSVKLYAIRDASTGELEGHFYADLYPREGKYPHAASAGVTVARLHDGKYQAPVSVLMANFNPSSGGRPPLLSHGEVETLFHEFGHICHQTLTTARYGSLSGTNVAQDFVEAPSQMLQNWVYQKDVLDRMSGHWQDPTRKLPAGTVARLEQARAFDAGYAYSRQVFYATLDLTLHTSGPSVDPDAVDSTLFGEIVGLSPVTGTHPPASFGHLMSGYDAAYYGYLWSEVFAWDMFSLFEKAGVLDPALGRRYREIILARGRSEEPDVLLRRFLGREPSNAAFLHGIGLE